MSLLNWIACHFLYFILKLIIKSFSSGGLELWWVNHTSVYKNSKSNVFKNIAFLGEISNNSKNDLFRTNEYKTLEFCW